MINKHFRPFNSKTAESQNADPYPANRKHRTYGGSAMTHSTIKDMAAEDRPREKLMDKGVEALTIAELLAILIGGGTKEKTAVELMQDIMNDCEGKLVNLSRMTMEDLMEYRGIGEAKALSIIAAAEIGRRRTLERISEIKKVENGKDVLELMQPRIQDLSHEESWALLLNNDGRLLRCVHLSQGGLTETAVDVRMLYKHACLANATCLIIVHNHPSGNLRPSAADKDLTQRVKKAGAIMNIRMLDHVIVTDGDYYSFAENGMV